MRTGPVPESPAPRFSRRPTFLRPGRAFEPFFESLRPAQQRVLLLDYDGAVAPPSESRVPETPYEEVAYELRRIAGASRPTRIALISGRPLAQLRRATGLEGVVELWGSHGLERLTLEGCWVGPPRAREATAFLQNVVTEIECRGWASLVERRPYGIALHAGGCPDAFADAEAELIDSWSDAAEEAGLELCGFDGGIELRPWGADKGMIVRRIVDGLDGEARVAYLGHDRAAEDAFRELGDAGLTILVRAEPRTTRAAGWLQPPQELRRFLGDWRSACGDA